MDSSDKLSLHSSSLSMDSSQYARQLREAATYVTDRIGGDSGDVGIVLGSGLGDLVHRVEHRIDIPYHDIPHMPEVSVSGHSGVLVFGSISGVKVFCFSGRHHSYEGIPMWEVCFIVRLCAFLGCKIYLLTNASGGCLPTMYEGCFMLIRDHIRFSLRDPLEMSGDPSFGSRFPDLTNCWSPELSQCARDVAREMSVDLFEGVYGWTQGPSYETHAEVLCGSSGGACAFGMSTVPEAISAHALGMKVMGLSMITNVAAGLKKEVLEHDAVKDVANRSGPLFQELVVKTLDRIRSEKILDTLSSCIPQLEVHRNIPMSAKYDRRVFSTETITEACAYLQNRIGLPASGSPIAIFFALWGAEQCLESVLGSNSQARESFVSVPLSEMPHFPHISPTWSLGRIVGVQGSERAYLCFEACSLEGFIRTEATYVSLLAAALRCEYASWFVAGFSIQSSTWENKGSSPFATAKLPFVSDFVNRSSLAPASLAFSSGFSTQFLYPSTESEFVYAYCGTSALPTSSECSFLRNSGISAVGSTSIEGPCITSALQLPTIVLFQDIKQGGCSLLEDSSIESFVRSSTFIPDLCPLFGSSPDSSSSADLTSALPIEQPIPIPAARLGDDSNMVQDLLTSFKSLFEGCFLNTPLVGLVDFVHIDSPVATEVVAYVQASMLSLRSTNTSDATVQVWEAAGVVDVLFSPESSLIHVLCNLSPSLRSASHVVRALVLLGIHSIVFVGFGKQCFSESSSESSNLGILTDHLNYTGIGPLNGPNMPEWGPRFFDMTHAHSPRLVQALQSSSLKMEGIQLKAGDGIFHIGLGILTKAERRFFSCHPASWACDSMIPDVLVVQHMRVSGKFTSECCCLVVNAEIEDARKDASLLLREAIPSLLKST